MCPSKETARRQIIGRSCALCSGQNYKVGIAASLYQGGNGPSGGQGHVPGFHPFHWLGIMPLCLWEAGDGEQSPRAFQDLSRALIR